MEMPYKKFKFTGKIETLTDAKIEELSYQVKQMDAFNDDLYRDKQVKRDQMLNLASSIWLQSSSQFKNIRRQKIETPPNNMREFLKLKRRWKKYLIAEAQRQKQRDYRQDYRARQHAAILQLTEMGFIIGQDFRRGNAISFLKDIEVSFEPAFPMTANIHHAD
jgi:hypothetical protein